MDLKLKDKVALVFGASQGIGKAVAESLLAEGCKVIISSRSKENLAETKEEIGATDFICADLSKSGQAKSAVNQCIKKFGVIDILITNTGGPQKGEFLEVSQEQWQSDYQSLWLSVTEAMQAALPQMQKNKFGRVLMITSIAAKEPLKGLTTSNGLRAGLAGLVRSVSTEVAADGITLNLLLPGYTNTDRIRALNLSEEKIKKMVPAGRLAEPNELGDLACFLASPKASYITGQSFAVDGGVLRSH